MIKQIHFIFVLLLFAALTLSACGVAGFMEQPQAAGDAAAPEEQAAPDASESAAEGAVESSNAVEDVEVEEAQLQPTETSVASQTPTEAPTAIQPEPTPTEVVVEVAPTVRADLSATSPGAVNLASGEVQLVEFFAYW
ncbi:MAG: hypothetical protein ISR58_21965 [Anaerolineales bacterium]|nr:hypothetical protein [Chloroflexota bacterium]MBL6983860.1 hypothetical protein [Anaerolineales bacterium]